MLARMRHPSARLYDAVKAVKGDPTGTHDIRKRYRALVETRWRQFAKSLRSVILNQDMLGLASNKPSSLTLALSGMGADAKIRAFQGWVDEALASLVLEHDTTYLDPMITIAYHRGVSRAQGLAVKTGRRRPVVRHAADQVLGLQQLVMVELQGINEAVSQKLVRIGATALIDGGLPVGVFNEMQTAIEQIGIVRARALVETMVVQAHGTATLDTFEAAGINKVGLLPEMVQKVRRIMDARRASGPGSRSSREKAPSARTIQRIRAAQRKLEKLERVDILTAGDDDVCPECEGIAEDGPYSINTARGLIPAHPSCRCSFVPADDDRFAGEDDD